MKIRIMYPYKGPLLKVGGSESLKCMFCPIIKVHLFKNKIIPITFIVWVLGRVEKNAKEIIKIFLILF